MPAFDLSFVRMALEYAQFKDYRVRDSLNNILRNVDSDLDEIGFEASPRTKESVDAFESQLTDIETEHAPKPAVFGFDERETLGVREVAAELGEDDVRALRTVNVDDELEEFVSELKSEVQKEQTKNDNTGN